MGTRKNCQGCKQPILDPYIMEVGREYWHESCVVCQVCKVALDGKCYQRDGRLLCKTDYDRLYGIKCSLCSQLVPRRELVMRVLGHIYHLECFTCTPCGHRLQKGEAFVIRNGKLICAMCLEHEAIAFQHCMTFGPMLNLPKDEEMAAMIAQNQTAADTARRGPKRPRTILSSHQRRAFKQSFEVSPKPCRKVRESLAKELGLSVRVVQVWFQNQRAKIKKLQRRQLTQTQGTASGKDKEASDDDDDDDSHLQLHSSDEDDSSSDDEKSASGSNSEKAAKNKKPQKGANRNSKQKKASNTNKRADKVVLEESSVVNQSTPAGQFLETGSLPVPATALDQGIVSQDCNLDMFGFADKLSNPIDGLYSMQSSYFSV